ncbi:unnamed protein product [Litomosoides sigmodontis]|uniref:BED-type domain-containing protein n=1 Tax=Litomosoides sigmodontis TaxID=42156 RepID=A0A3P7JTQ6_LITSI|nr:unnamed protein product [Litomosoides sigmodontis]
MLEGRNETLPSNLDVVFHPEACVNSEKSNGDHHISSSITDCNSHKISSLSASSSAMIIDEEREMDSGSNILSVSNVGEYSMEMLARLTSSTMTLITSDRPDNNVKSGAAKKRKSQKFKPSSVWEHFVRLSDGNVRCVHCAKVLKRKDSSTKTMWGHLRAIHFKGQDWTVLQQRALRDRNRQQTSGMDVPSSLDELNPSGIITTQNWLEQRVGILCDKPQEAQTASETIAQMDDSSTDSFAQSNRSSLVVSNGCCTTNLNNHCTYNGSGGLNATFLQVSDRNTEEKSRNFLSSIPHTSEVINITAGYSESTDNHCLTLNGRLEENGNGGYSNADISAAALNVSNSLISSVQNHLNAADQSVSSINPALLHIFDSFSIFDSDSMATFMRAATDLDCTLSFHCRNNQPHLSFESNHTAANKLKYCFAMIRIGAISKDRKGVEVSLSELDDEVLIVVQSDGRELDRESWKKTDKAQFMWAIRGKCQKVLTQ